MAALIPVTTQSLGRVTDLAALTFMPGDSKPLLVQTIVQNQVCK